MRVTRAWTVKPVRLSVVTGVPGHQAYTVRIPATRVDALCCIAGATNAPSWEPCQSVLERPCRYCASQARAAQIEIAVVSNADKEHERRAFLHVV
eukprot:2128255-Amphidinium_carterae.1